MNPRHLLALLTVGIREASWVRPALGRDPSASAPTPEWKGRSKGTRRSRKAARS